MEIKSEKISNKTPELIKKIPVEEFDDPVYQKNFKNNDIAKEEKVLKDIQSAKEIPEKEYEQIKTMADFIKMLEDRLTIAEDVQEKNAIAYNLLRVKNAFVELKIKPEKFKIGITEDGKWSAYNKNVQEFRVSKELLESVEDCRVDAKEMKISFKEAELGKDGVADTGFQQLIIEKSGVNSGEYHKEEKWGVKRIFCKWGEKNVLDLIDKPKEFADFFLKKEIEKRLKQARKIKSKDLASYLSKQFEKGAPKLYQKLKASNYDFCTRTKEIILSLEKNI
ncbi:hypothetical protein KAI65_01225 [Candidatus Parcubacteria bacterium]|nr:hypothetical protein [Candidatus Parcubacteria bacterium]